MQAPLFLEHQGDLAGQTWKVQGDIKLAQKNLIPVTGARTIYDYSLIGEEYLRADGDGQIQWSSLIRDSSRRNESIIADPMIESWQSLNGDPRNLGLPPGTSALPFTANINLRVPVQPIKYVPPLSQVLKQGWVQYFSLFALTSCFLFPVFSFLIKNKIFPTSVTVTGGGGGSSSGAPWKKFPSH